MIKRVLDPNINIETIKKIAKQAGEEILKIYQQNFEVSYKKDNSPLTQADMKSNEIICEALQKYYPTIPILSEENREIPFEIRKEWRYYWSIDPIDGTKEFIKKNGEFTVNIALIYQSQPILGVVYAPVLDDMYSAKQGEGAFLNNQRLPLVKNHTTLQVVASQSHLNDATQKFIEDLKKIDNTLTLISKGSSLKLCMVAEGSATIYPRIAPTMEWDTAAAHAILLESGKNIYPYNQAIDAKNYLKKNLSLPSMLYNKENLLNPSFVVV